MMMIIARY